jgi:hypothetical protein
MILNGNSYFNFKSKFEDLVGKSDHLDKTLIGH